MAVQWALRAADVSAWRLAQGSVDAWGARTAWTPAESLADRKDATKDVISAGQRVGCSAGHSAHPRDML